MTMINDRDKALVDALIFASPRPIGIDMIQETSGLGKKEILEAIQILSAEYDERSRGFSLEEVAGGYQLRTRPEFAEQVGKLFLARAKRRFSRSSLEALSIIAYRQPVLRSEVEKIRGVDSGGVIKTLLTQGMVRVLGRKNAPGRPILYGTSAEFLEYFGLRDIESLPTLQEVAELESIDEISGEVAPARDDDIDQDGPWQPSGEEEAPSELETAGDADDQQDNQN